VEEERRGRRFKSYYFSSKLFASSLFVEWNHPYYLYLKERKSSPCSYQENSRKEPLLGHLQGHDSTSTGRGCG